jgi:hypothetical protein
LVGNRIADRVARQIASRIPEVRSDFASEFAAIDVGKVAAAVAAKLKERKGKSIDYVDLLASQIVAQLALPRIQGSTAGAVDFQNRMVAAVVDAVRKQRAEAVEPVGEQAAGDKTAATRKRT